MAEIMCSGATGAAINLGGRLTLATAQQTRETLLAALATEGPVELVLDAAAEFDISFVQLLEAARNLVQRRGSSVTIRPPVPALLLRILTEGGFGEGMLAMPRSAA